MRVVSTSHYQSFEHIAVFLHGSGIKCLFVVIYRPGSAPASSAFFEELADLFDSVTNYSSVIIIGDINIHLDHINDTGTVSFSSLLSTSHLVQVVQSPSHVAGHTLDIVVVKSDCAVTAVNVPPPVLSDHSMIDVEFELRVFKHYDTVTSSRRVWRSFNYDEFERDLSQSGLVRSPVLGMDSATLAR